MQQTCRQCRGTLDPFLDLGALQLSGYLRPDEEARPSWPLVLCSCADCSLVQLRDTTPPALLFERYWYRSGVNEVMRAELRDVAVSAAERVGLADDDIVLDIGANDGTLLQSYRPRVTRIAFEPARNLTPVLRSNADMLFADYFPNEFPQLRTYLGRVKIITSIAMVYAVDDLAPFLAAIQQLLHQDGVWVVQFQDLAGMIRSTAFDNICHEHLTYWSLQTFMQLVAPYGLQVMTAEHRAINGGSYRLTIQHRSPGRVSDPSVERILAEERGCHSWGVLERFAWQVGEVSRQIRSALRTAIERGQTIDLYGASTKANTLLQVCGLTDQWLRRAWERSPEKWGLRTAGTDIPIVSEEDGREDEPPDALLCGIWQFRDAVLAREALFLEQGGTIIFPLPTVDVVMKERARAHA